MICQQFTSLLGFACHPLDDAGSVALVETPFRFSDGTPARVFVEHLGNRLRFFDDGETFLHFRGRGLKMESGIHTRFLATAAEQHGAALTNAGEIEVWANEADAPFAFAKYVGMMLALFQWEKEHADISHDTELFVEEVAMYLAAWKGAEHIRRKPKITGLTGRAYEFDFDMDGTLVLAISAHHQSASSALHKLVDVRGLPANQGIDSLIVIDDRTDHKTAKAETMVLGAVSRVMGMQQLQRNAKVATSIQ